MGDVGVYLFPGIFLIIPSRENRQNTARLTTTMLAPVGRLNRKDSTNPIIKHTNKGGATNIVKNPALILWDDLNKSALSYWRDLGLTPAGLKKIDEAALKGKKQSTLEKALSELG